MQLFRLYQETINLLKQKFTRGELCMIIDIMNGTYLDPHTLPRVMSANTEDSFDLYPGMYEEKWKVEKGVMLEKLKPLNDFQSSCLSIWANDFWYGSNLSPSGGGKGEDVLDLDKYIKESPVITQQLQSAIVYIRDAIERMEASKGAFKSAQIAEARESAQKAKEILEKLI